MAITVLISIAYLMNIQWKERYSKNVNKQKKE